MAYKEKRTPFKLRSGNNTPFKQLGSTFGMTRSQARKLSRKHGATMMPGESRYEMHQRLRRAGTLEKHIETRKVEKQEQREAGKIKREKFVQNIKDFGGGITDALSRLGGKVKKVGEVTTGTDTDTGTGTGDVTTNTYTIKRGDSLSKIAKTYGTTVEELMKKNPQIKDKNKIFSGDTIEY